VVRYTAVNDLGTIVNPLLVEGQIQGGVVQGLGQVLLEQAIYDSDGQLVTGSFMDYAMPRAHDAPMINIVSHPVPTKSNPLGAKGCGEAGTSGGLPSVANAVIDALSEYDIRHLEMPMTPARIWQAIQGAKARQVSLNCDGSIVFDGPVQFRCPQSDRTRQLHVLEWHGTDT